jgi:hypothetical protein
MCPHSVLRQNKARTNREMMIMRKFLLGFIFSMLVAQSAAADDKEKLYGVWKLDSFLFEDAQTKGKKGLFGEHPKGFLILLPTGRMAGIVTADGRKVPQSDPDRVAAFQSLIAYSGKFRLEGDKFLTRVEVAWNEAWVGTDQARTFKLEGDKLFIISTTQPHVNFGGRMMTGILSWDREK